MKKYSEDINDNEIRLVGSSQPTPNGKFRWKYAVLIGLAVLALAAGLTLLLRDRQTPVEEDIIGIYEPQPMGQTTVYPLRGWLYGLDGVTVSGCGIKDTMVNDIAVRVYVPLNAKPRLEIGIRCLADEKVILAFQAADIRADNQKIVGAFVERGKPVAWGLSKKGYCAILRDNMYVGMADNSPLFEEATDCGGYFFRQYPLVANGMAQESELKTQSIRRALCEVNEHICVVETQEKASMHDFAVLLTDLGVKNAIYLIGSDAMGTFTDLNGTKTALGRLVEKPYKYTNFLYWSRD